MHAGPPPPALLAPVVEGPHAANRDLGILKSGILMREGPQYAACGEVRAGYFKIFLAKRGHSEVVGCLYERPRFRQSQGRGKERNQGRPRPRQSRG